ncbi:glycosyltransferase [uncultured Cohaesibacter sp.]|uniref:glycosyltransferase family 4 protein n=1 Tax=uncultured Cohaesibacter sp. TaxID=1002546 RepID=UPI002930BAF4|nr:glycosyltransferase [uncultured Cohaesibacter sp.]
MIRSFFYKVLKFNAHLLNRLVRVYYYREQATAFELTFEEELRDWQPDIIQCHDWQTLRLGSKIKDELGSYLIFDSHELETHRNPPMSPSRKRWMEAYEKTHLPKCDLVSTVGGMIGEYLEEHYGVPLPAVVYNAPIEEENVRPSVFERWGKSAQDCTVRDHIPMDTRTEDLFLMVVVGNVTVNRGVETVLTAMRDIPQNAHLAIVGRINDQFRSIVGQLIEQGGLEGRVHLVDPVNPVEVVPFISTADLGVIPLIPATLSYDLALPNKLFECAFADLPIVASNTREIKKMIDQHQLGETCIPNDSDALAKAINKMMMQIRAGERKQDNSAFREMYRFEKNARPVLDAIASAPLLETSSVKS